MSRLVMTLTLLMLAGCNAVIDYPINGVVSLSAKGAGGVEVCATYAHEDDTPTECCNVATRWRVIDLDASGRGTDSDRPCGGQPAEVTEWALPDGGKLVFADSNLSSLDSAGHSRWTVPSPFGTLTAATATAGDLFIGRGPQVARVSLADGNVVWISELR
jgi:hypothetical protein